MTNEPTTGEIVRALRCDGDANNCVDCRYATYDTATILCDQEQNVREAADRLESQAKQIAELTAAIKTQSDLCRECAALTVIEQKAEIDALTARAEKAEKERDAAVEMRNNAMRGVEGIKRGQQDGEGA